MRLSVRCSALSHSGTATTPIRSSSGNVPSIIAAKKRPSSAVSGSTLGGIQSKRDNNPCFTKCSLRLLPELRGGLCPPEPALDDEGIRTSDRQDQNSPLPVVQQKCGGGCEVLCGDFSEQPRDRGAQVAQRLSIR